MAPKIPAHGVHSLYDSPLSNVREACDYYGILPYDQFTLYGRNGFADVLWSQSAGFNLLKSVVSCMELTLVSLLKEVERFE